MSHVLLVAIQQGEDDVPQSSIPPVVFFDLIRDAVFFKVHFHSRRVFVFRSLVHDLTIPTGGWPRWR